MPRLSDHIAKLEKRLERQIERIGRQKLKTYALLFAAGW